MLTDAARGRLWRGKTRGAAASWFAFVAAIGRLSALLARPQGEVPGECCIPRNASVPHWLAGVDVAPDTRHTRADVMQTHVVILQANGGLHWHCDNPPKHTLLSAQCWVNPPTPSLPLLLLLLLFPSSPPACSPVPIWQLLCRDAIHHQRSTRDDGVTATPISSRPVPCLSAQDRRLGLQLGQETDETAVTWTEHVGIPNSVLHWLRSDGEYHARVVVDERTVAGKTGDVVGRVRWRYETGRWLV